MKRNMLIVITILMTISACKQKVEETTAMNPFFTEWDTPFGTPPFDLIQPGHYMPAFEEGMARQNTEIEAIIANTEAPTFVNTIEAIEYSGSLLRKVNAVFNNIADALISDTIQQLAKAAAPLLSAHQDEILMNPGLFARVREVYEQKDALGLGAEQARLLEEMYKDFTQSGANLSPEQQARLKEINKELSVKTLAFGDHVLAETNAFELVIEDKADLDGLPGNVIQAAAEAATEKGYEGKYLFTTQKPSLIPFLQYSTKRDLREKMFKAYSMKGDNGNEFDNKELVREIINLRIEKANLLGFPTHAHRVLSRNMARTPGNVDTFLKDLMDAAVGVASQEAVELQQMMKSEGSEDELMPWDWWFYAEKVRKAKYDLDEEALRPYFKLENVRDGVFDVATKLWGLQFVRRNDIPVYHPEVEVYEIQEADGKHLGILYMDFFPRESKRGGAWMSEYRGQYRTQEGTFITPIICNVLNFTKPSGDQPALISFEEALTLFHEFGHGLHGLLSDCTYPSLAGTNVSRDFVELPSQVMENWASEPEVLRSYARHYQTSEVIPDELITKMQNSRYFNKGFEMTEYLAASILDMAWHMLEVPYAGDVNAFEEVTMDKAGLIPEIIPRYRTSYFSHSFSWGYSAGYYSYVWAQVLDADAFQAFKETSLFDAATARSLRDNILSRGNTADPMELYIAFRGKEPGKEALLRRNGLIRD